MINFIFAQDLFITQKVCVILDLKADSFKNALILLHHF